MSQLEQIFHHETLWTNIPLTLKNAIRDINNQANWSVYSRSRSLADVLHNTCMSYWGNRSIAYKTLAGMCALLHNNYPISIIPKYRTISSQASETLQLQDIINEDFPRTTNNTHTHIYLYHIPKGKSYIKKLLDENTELNRLKQIETFCIENTQHFVRIYKGFGNTDPTDITIFTDQFTNKTIDTLFIMLPNLLDLQPYEITDPFPKEYEIYNNRVNKLREIFAYLYAYYCKTDTTTISDEKMETIKIDLLSLINEFTELFNFNLTNINTFSARLAKAKNDNANKYLTNELNRITNNITTTETQLNEYYIRKIQLERELLATKLANEDDIKPFLETINNTKAIEILDTSATEMRLRVTAPLQYFTTSDFEHYETNTASNYNQMFATQPLTKKVLHKIFATREYSLIAQAIITLRINEGYYDVPLTLNAQTNSTDNLTEFPNPHLFHHNCWSAARNEINKNVCAGNFELVVMQMVAAVQTINVAEHASFINGLLYDIKERAHLRQKIHLINKEGNTLTFTEAIEYEKMLEDKQQTEAREKTLEKAKETIENTKKGYTQVELPDNDADWEDVPDFIPNF